MIAMAGDNQAAHIPCQGDGGGRHVVQFKRRKAVPTDKGRSRSRSITAARGGFAASQVLADVISPRSCEHLDLVAGAR